MVEGSPRSISRTCCCVFQWHRAQPTPGSSWSNRIRPPSVGTNVQWQPKQLMASAVALATAREMHPAKDRGSKELRLKPCRLCLSYLLPADLP